MFPDPDKVERDLPLTFFSRLTPADLSARRASSREEYLSRYKAAIRRFSTEEKRILTSHTRAIDSRYVRFSRFNMIPWKFVKLDDATVENDFPHTLGPFVFLPASFFRTHSHHNIRETIMHEKIHVYQRTFPQSTAVLIRQLWMYVPVGLLSSRPLARSNPDLDGIAYARNGKTCLQEYNSASPSSLTDSSRCEFEPFEHPYEKMAYTLAKIMNTGVIGDADERSAALWAETHFA
jgi:hypothetical protein